MNHEKPRVLGVRTMCQTAHFEIESVKLRFSNGNEREYERIACPSSDTVIVAAMKSPGVVLLVREYAVGLDRYELCLPTGRASAGESVLVAATRELREETGYSARHLEHLHTLSLFPGIFSYQAQVVLATDLYPSSSSGDEPERLEVVHWDLARLDRAVVTHEICEARTLAALFLVRAWWANSLRAPSPPLGQATEKSRLTQ
jgi:ADP-ribose diphosphatase